MEIERIDPTKARRQLAKRIQTLAADPRPARSEKLAGARHRSGVRQRPYRIAYHVPDERLAVVLVTIEHPREVYKNL